MQWLSAICEPIDLRCLRGQVARADRCRFGTCHAIAAARVEATGIERPLLDWNGSSKSSWTRIGRLVTNSVTKRWDQKASNHTAMKRTARSSEIMASRREHYGWVAQYD